WPHRPRPWRAVHTAFGRHGQNLYLLVVTREKPDEPSGRGGVQVWSVREEGRRLTELGKFNSEVEAPFTSAAFSPDCKRVVAFRGEGDPGAAAGWEGGAKSKPTLLKREAPH